MGTVFVEGNLKANSVPRRLMHSEKQLQEELARIHERERTLDEENSRLRIELSMHQVSIFDSECTMIHC